MAVRAPPSASASLPGGGAHAHASSSTSGSGHAPPGQAATGAAGSSGGLSSAARALAQSRSMRVSAGGAAAAPPAAPTARAAQQAPAAPPRQLPPLDLQGVSAGGPAAGTLAPGAGRVVTLITPRTAALPAEDSLSPRTEASDLPVAFTSRDGRFPATSSSGNGQPGGAHPTVAGVQFLAGVRFRRPLGGAVAQVRARGLRVEPRPSVPWAFPPDTFPENCSYPAQVLSNNRPVVMNNLGGLPLSSADLPPGCTSATSMALVPIPAFAGSAKVMGVLQVRPCTSRGANERHAKQRARVALQP